MKLLNDIWNAILEDSWMWISVWGPNRTGKSTLCMQLSYDVYKDWDKVLQSVTWNLTGLRYKMKKGEPSRLLTRNMLHNRVPLLILDDFGATSNKAKTQHDMAWDIFKGSFDTYSTKIAVVIANMLIPSEPTYQLYQKYTHEVFVYSRGQAKYDTVRWEQDFSGWQARQDKEWLQDFDFDKIPDHVYKQYDEMRCSVADELDQQVEDAMVDNITTTVLKRLLPIDIELMETIEQKGQVKYDFLHLDCNDKYHDALIRCKARNIIVPIRKQTRYWYDLTDFGFQALQSWRQMQNLQATIPNMPGAISATPISPSQSFASKAMVSKKLVAENYRFQGYRVTESFDKADPDLVVWKDATTPLEVIALKTINGFCTLDIGLECQKEVKFAQSRGLQEIHLICMDLAGKKVFDGSASFTQKVEVH
jgi:hypothetical protein